MCVFVVKYFCFDLFGPLKTRFSLLRNHKRTHRVHKGRGQLLHRGGPEATSISRLSQSSTPPRPPQRPPVGLPYSRLSAPQTAQRQTARTHPRTASAGCLLRVSSMSRFQEGSSEWSPGWEDGEPVVPAGTRPHKGPSVLPGEWESTTVAMFVTSSPGRIWH